MPCATGPALSLYYYYDGNLLVWASELKAIAAYFGPNRLVTDNTAMIDFLTYRYIPSPKTIYRNVYKLPPASILHLVTGPAELSVRKYWELPVTETSRPFAVLIEELREKFASSVEAQLVCDVPLGLLLSGGIDFSAVTMMASRAVKQLRSFSIGFRGTDRDETSFAGIVAKQANTVHHVHRIEQVEMQDVHNGSPTGLTNHSATVRRSRPIAFAPSRANPLPLPCPATAVTNCLAATAGTKDMIACAACSNWFL